MHWPTRDETRAATIAVIIGVAVMALYPRASSTMVLQIVIQRVLS